MNAFFPCASPIDSGRCVFVAPAESRQRSDRLARARRSAAAVSFLFAEEEFPVSTVTGRTRDSSADHFLTRTFALTVESSRSNELWRDGGLESVATFDSSNWEREAAIAPVESQSHMCASPKRIESKRCLGFRDSHFPHFTIYKQIIAVITSIPQSISTRACRLDICFPFLLHLIPSLRVPLCRKKRLRRFFSFLPPLAGLG